MAIIIIYIIYTQIPPHLIAAVVRIGGDFITKVTEKDTQVIELTTAGLTGILCLLVAAWPRRATRLHASSARVQTPNANGEDPESPSQHNIPKGHAPRYETEVSSDTQSNRFASSSPTAS